MNSFTSIHQDPLKVRWEEKSNASLRLPTSSTPLYYQRFVPGVAAPSTATASMLPPPPPSATRRRLLEFPDDDIASAVVPPVTVVLEGRSICHRIHLHKHTGYESLAAALRCMFVDEDGAGEDREGSASDSRGSGGSGGSNLDLSNAVPGYVVAYEDMEDDLLLAGDLSWKDFVRVAKRIRILPAKPNRRKNTN